MFVRLVGLAVPLGMRAMILVSCLVAIAWAGSLAAAWRLGKASFRTARRKAMNLPPPVNGGIMSLVPAVNGPCPSCGVQVRRHPAQTDKRCTRCIAEAMDRADEDAQKAEGWGA
jgi:hypothetical protein